MLTVQFHMVYMSSWRVTQNTRAVRSELHARWRVPRSGEGVTCREELCWDALGSKLSEKIGLQDRLGSLGDTPPPGLFLERPRPSLLGPERVMGRPSWLGQDLSFLGSQGHPGAHQPRAGHILVLCAVGEVVVSAERDKSTLHRDRKTVHGPGGTDYH